MQAAGTSFAVNIFHLQPYPLFPCSETTLTATIEKAAITEGYAFHTGFAYRINNGIAKFPAAWLLPVRIIAVEGRRDGYLTYQMTLYLMHLDKKPRPESRERQWADAGDRSLTDSRQHLRRQTNIRYRENRLYTG